MSGGTAGRFDRFKVMRRGNRPHVTTDPALRALRAERRRARLKVIPSLFTLGNAACGFAAIVQLAAVNFEKGVILNPENFVHAAWLILLAMLFDGIDGRIARMTESTGDFGGELDSLCDAVSFGVAPALMVAMANAKAISSPLFAKMSWLFGLAFACGAILRLARFNVENSHDDEAHLSFKGLPSPAAAGTIVSSLLFQGFLREHGFLRAASWVSAALPFLALTAGYLMVSTVRYIHLPNRYLRGRKSIRKIAQLFFLGVIVFALFPEIVLAAGFLGYAASGPIATAIAYARGERPGAFAGPIIEVKRTLPPATLPDGQRVPVAPPPAAPPGGAATDACGTRPTSGSAPI